MNSVSFGNLVVLTKNNVKKTEKFIRKLTAEEAPRKVKYITYKELADETDGRKFPRSESIDIYEAKIQTRSQEQESTLLQKIHLWAVQNKINLRVDIEDIDIDESPTRRMEKVFHQRSPLD